jgi:hypothetical protein
VLLNGERTFRRLGPVDPASALGLLLPSSGSTPTGTTAARAALHSPTAPDALDTLWTMRHWLTQESLSHDHYDRELPMTMST